MADESQEQQSTAAPAEQQQQLPPEPVAAAPAPSEEAPPPPPAEPAAAAATEAKAPQQQQQQPQQRGERGPKPGGGGGGGERRPQQEGQANRPPREGGRPPGGGGGGDRGPRPGGERREGGPRHGGGGDRREGGPRPGGGGDRGGFRMDGPLEIDLEKLIGDSLYLDNQAHAVVSRLRDMDSGTKSQLRRFYNAVRRACRTPEGERQHEFVMLRARLAYTIARHSLRSLDSLEKLLLQVTRKNSAPGYERFRDLFEAIVAYNE